MAVFNAARNRKPIYGAQLNKSHWLGSKMSMCAPLLGPGGPQIDMVSGVPLKVVNPGFAGNPSLKWTRASNNSGKAAYFGSTDDWILQSGWIDGNCNLLATAPVRTYVVVLGTTSATLSVSYGNLSPANMSTFPITAAAFQTALTGLTSVGTGNATVTGPNNGPFVVTLLSTVATWPSDLAFTGAANPGVLTVAPTAGLQFNWSPKQITRFRTVPTSLFMSMLIKPASSLSTQGLMRYGDTREGLPMGMYTSVVNNEFAIPYNANSLQEYTFSLGDNLWVAASWTQTTLDVWINGVHQTQVSGGSLSNQWAQQVNNSRPSQEMAITHSTNGPGTTLQGPGSTNGAVNNAGISFCVVGHNTGGLVDADVQRWANDGLFCYMYPTRNVYAFPGSRLATGLVSTTGLSSITT